MTHKYFVATCPHCLKERPSHQNGVLLGHPLRRNPKWKWCGDSGGHEVKGGFNVRQVTHEEWVKLCQA